MAASSHHGQLQQGAIQAQASNAQLAVKRARYEALHDGPSSLPNGRYFRERLEQALRRVEPPSQALAVLYIGFNLGEFKPAIDACGREAGDKFLRSMAAGLAAAPRAEDMLSCFASDEFVCLAPGLAKREHLSALAARLLRSVPYPLRIGALQLWVRPSIGIAIHPADGTSAEVLLSNAKFAMHRARQRGASPTFVDEG